MAERTRSVGLSFETLVAYVEGLLPVEERSKVQAEIDAAPEQYEWHVPACCEPRTRAARPAPTKWVLVVAVALAAACATDTRPQTLELKGRTTDARLIGEPFRPLQAPARSLEERAVAANALLALPATGFSGWIFPALELGREPDVIAEARRALADRPDYEALVSLSAAYLRSARDGNDLERVAHAVDAAIRGTMMAADRPEAWFNRGAGLERLGLAEVLKPWEDYLRVDGVSDWASEASTRAQAPSRTATMTSGESLRRRIEHELLPAWARLARADDSSGAARILAEAKVVASDLSRLYHDDLMLRLLGELDHVDPNERERVGAGFEDAERAWRLLDQGRPSQACQLRAGITRNLSHVPVAVKLADLLAGYCLYYASDHSRARELLTALVRWAASGGHQSLAGRAAFVLAAVEVRAARPGAADRHYRDAREWLSGSGESSYRASAFAIAARQAHEQGDDGTAWELLRSAFLGWPEIRGPLHAYTVLSTVTRVALDSGLEGLAYDVSTAQLAAAEQSGIPSLAAEAVAERGRLLAALGQADAARAAIAESYRRVAAIDDPAVRPVSAGLVDIAAAQTISAADPCAAVTGFRAALQKLSGRLNQRRAVVSLDLGDALERCGQLQEAALAYGTGIDALEQALAAQEVEARRISHADRLWDLYGRLARLQAVNLGLVDEAFLTIDRGRSAWIGHSPPTRSSIADVRRRLGRTTVIAYLVLERESYVWALTAAATTFRRIDVGRGHLAALVDQWTTRMLQGVPERREAHALYRLIVAPVEDATADAPITAIMADGPLHGVAFGALWNGRQYWAETTATWAIGAIESLTEQPATPRRAARSLVVANPTLDGIALGGAVPLPSAEREAREVAGFYDHAQVLSGREATRPAVLAALSTATIVHVAAHAIVDLSRPFDSRIPLAGGPEAALTVRDLIGVRGFSLRLVVLAACRSAAGKPVRGFGATSLAHVLAQGVSGAAVGALWDVDDALAPGVARELHRRIAAGMPVAEAIRGAQVALIERDDEFSAPRVWGAMIGVGRPTTVLGGSYRPMN